MKLSNKEIFGRFAADKKLSDAQYCQTLKLEQIPETFQETHKRLSFKSISQSDKNLK